MKYFENIQFPLISKTPTHTVESGVFFIKSEQAPNFDTPSSSETKFSAKSDIIVLQEYIGYKGKWSKVSYNEEIGYVLNTDISPLPNTKPSIKANTEQYFLPDPSYPEINWRDEQSNIPFLDNKRGLYCVVYETGVQRITDSLSAMMENALYNGLAIIFSELGKASNDFQSIKTLQDTYYMFGTAEAVDVSFRLCSTFRVLVTIPKTYAQTNFIKRSKEDSFLGTEVTGSSSVLNVSVLAGDTTVPTSDSDFIRGGNIIRNISPPPPRIIEIELNRKWFDADNYDDFFKGLNDKFIGIPKGSLDILEVIYNNNNWKISPVQDLNISQEISDINFFKKKMDFFIFSNLPKNKKIIEEVVSWPTPSDPTGYVSILQLLTLINGAQDNFLVSAPELYWKGTLTLKIDIDKLKLISVKFVTPETNKKIKFNIGVKKFINDEQIQSKTTLNYILQRNLTLQKFNIKKEIRNYVVENIKEKILNQYKTTQDPKLLQILKDLSDVSKNTEIISKNITDKEIIDIKNKFINDILKKKNYKQCYENLDFFKKQIDELKASDILYLHDEFFVNPYLASLGSAVGTTVNLITDIFAGTDVMSDLGPEAELSRFLINYHYPKIESIEKIPFDAFKCISTFEDNISRIKNKYNINIKQQFVDLQKVNSQSIIEREGSEWQKYVKYFNWQDKGKLIKNQDWRYVLRIDPMPTPPTDVGVPVVWWQANNYYIPAFMRLGLGEVLQDAFLCAVRSIPPATLANIVKYYSNAKKGLDEFLSSTLCNPLLNGVLTKLANIEIPQLFIYDPNSNLADTLLGFLGETLMKLIAASLKSLMHSAANSCLSDPNKELKPGSSNLLDPLSNSIKDANINNLLENLGLLSPIPPEVLNQQARNDISRPQYEIVIYDTTRQIEIESGKKVITDLVSDCTCLLSGVELCSLLKGNSVSTEVINLLNGIIRTNYPQISNNLRTSEEIRNFFKTLGTVTYFNFCDLVENSPIPSVRSCSCQDEEVDKAREILLNGFDPNFPYPKDPNGRPTAGRGLNPEESRAIIDSVKERERKGVEDILKYLDDPTSLIDPTNLPPFLCTKLPNGTVIPPAININPSVDNFKKMIDADLKNSYSLFNKEAENWSKATYSIEPREETRGMLAFDESKGNIKINNDYVKNLTNNKMSEEEAKKKIFYNIIHPNYLYNKVLDNFISSLSVSPEILNVVDGNEICKFDLGIALERYRDRLEKSQANLIEFAEEFLREFATKSMSLQSVIDILNKSSLSANVTTSGVGWLDEAYKATYYSLGLVPSGVDYIKLLDLLIRSPEQKYMETFNKKYTSRDFSEKEFLEKNGSNIYKNIMDSMYADKDNIFKYIREFLAKEYLANNLQDLFDDYNGKDGNIGIKVYSDTIQQVIHNYPRYSLKYNENISEEIPQLYKNLSNQEVTGKKEDFSEYKDIFDLKIYKNKSSPSRSYIKIQNFNIVDNQVQDIIKELKLKKIDKESIFLEYVLKTSTNNSVSKEDYKIIYSEIYKNICKKIKINPFNKKILIQENKENSKYNSYKPFTDYLKLVIPATRQEEACGVIPHFLDTDLLKQEAVEGKTKSLCLEEAINSKIRQNKPISANELDEVETNDVQKVLLNLCHRLTLRAYIADIVLRGINIFGIYEPQEFRSDPLFVSFISAMIESEMRGEDILYYELMTSFFIEKYNRQNPDQNLEINDKNRTFILTETIKLELKTSTLPKLSKRIMEDTTQEIKKFLILSQTSKGLEIKFEDGTSLPTEINLKTIDNFENIKDLLESDIIKIREKDGVSYLAVYEYIDVVTFFTKNLPDTISSAISLATKAYDINKISADILTQIVDGVYVTANQQRDFEIISREEKLFVKKEKFAFKISGKDIFNPDFRLLFQYLFPIKRMISYLFINDVLATSTRRQVLNTFISTKAFLRRMAKNNQSAGQPIISDLNDPQQLSNDDPYIFLMGEIFKILITTPFKIVKGFIEGADPNVALSSGIYKVLKQLAPDTPSIIVPGIGVPLQFWLGSPFMLNPLNLIYYVGGFWIDMPNAASSSEIQKRKMINNLLQSPEDIECSEITLFNQDRIILTNDGKNIDPEGYYKKQYNADLLKVITAKEKQIRKEKEQEEQDLEEQLD